MSILFMEISSSCLIFGLIGLALVALAAIKIFLAVQPRFPLIFLNGKMRVVRGAEEDKFDIERQEVLGPQGESKRWDYVTTIRGWLNVLLYIRDIEKKNRPQDADK